MAEVQQEKSRGLKFAEQQLLRHGWEHGKGLGRAENGISEAIRVKVKCDKGGVGHREGEQFSFHWWDHVFNKASASLQVESAQSGITLKKSAEDDEDGGMISNKKPRKASQAKAKLYGCFVKSATLLSGQEQPEPKSSDSDDSSCSDEDEDEQKLDLSSTTKLSDADLMKVCGGRTAHKGARHGLTMSAKLARLEQQEAEFMARYGGKSSPESSSPVCVPATPQTSQSEETTEKCRGKKMKEKKSTEEFGNTEADVQPKKKKKKKKKSGEDEEGGGTVCCEEDSDKTRRKHKKRTKMAEQNGDEALPSPTAEPNHATKKKKKSSRQEGEPGDEEDRIDQVAGQSDRTLQEETHVLTSAKKQKRKKCKQDKLLMDRGVDQEPLPPKKKKSKD